MKPQGGDIPNIRSLGGGHCHVQLCILGCPPPPTSFTHQKARGKCYDELKLYILIHEAYRRGNFLIVTPASQE